MIRESEFFEFDGIKSTEFKIRNVSVGDGLYEEAFMASRSINEVSIPGRADPYFFGIDESPLSFPVSFCFDEKWNDSLIDRVKRWLKADTYRPLSFSADRDRVFYAMFVDSSTLVHNGLKQGYITLNVRCNSSRVSSRKNTSKVYTCNDELSFDILNHGHFDIFPTIEIKKIGDGDVTFINQSRPESVMEFTSLQDGEFLKINGESRSITSDLVKLYNYNNFNDFYLPLYEGNNAIKVKGACKFKLTYTFKFTS